MSHGRTSYWTIQIVWCADCPRSSLQCTTGKERRIKRWEHEAAIDAMQERLGPHAPCRMSIPPRAPSNTPSVRLESVDGRYPLPAPGPSKRLSKRR